MGTISRRNWLLGSLINSSGMVSFAAQRSISPKEVGLEGFIRSINPVNRSWHIEVDTFVSPSGSYIFLDPTRTKEIRGISPQTPPPLLGQRVAVVGIDKGPGLPLTARVTRFISSTIKSPNPTDLMQSTVSPRIPQVRMDSEREFYSMDAWRSRLSILLQELSKQPIQSPVSWWRTLVLFYPYTDTDYIAVDDSRQHFRGALSDAQISSAVQVIQQLPGFIKTLTAGACEMHVDIRVINRYVQFGGIGRRGDPSRNATGFQHPVYQVECLPEKRLYNDPNPYDCVIVLYYPGPIQQDLGGEGGFVNGQLLQHIQYNAAKDSVLGFTHELIHGLDGLFMGRGYRGMALHHLFWYGGMSRDFDWYPALLQGRMLALTESPYGYSRAVWMSGSPTKPARGLLPVKLWTPLSGVTIPQGSTVRFAWNPAHAQISPPAKYRFLLYEKHSLETPLREVHTAETTLSVTLDKINPGSYLWTVQRIDFLGNASPIGESLELNVSAQSDPNPIVFTPLTQQNRDISCRALCFQVYIAVTSVSGLAYVYAELTYSDGSVQKCCLRKHSPNENEPIWEGMLALSPPHPSLEPIVVQIAYVAVDQAGRTQKLSGGERRITTIPPPANRSVLAATATPLNPITLSEVRSFPDIPAHGGFYPFYFTLQTVSAEGAWPGGTVGWIQISSPGTKPDKAGMERYFSFNGMTYGQYLFPENKTGSPIIWSVRFFVDQNNALIQTRTFDIKQNASSTSRVVR